MMKNVITLALLGLLYQATSSLAADFILVDPEAGAAPIVIPTGLPPRTRDAAVTLADTIEQISGLRPQLIEGDAKEIPKQAIWVGIHPRLIAAAPDLDLQFEHPEETLIAVSETAVVIAGRDRWNPDHTEEKGRLSIKTGMQQEYGTANAVYTFIRDQLNVRWLWPGETDFVKRTRITVAPFEKRYHPPFRARAGVFQKLSLGDNQEGIDELWARFQRVQLDSMELIGGHGFGDWWDLYGATHPEYFAAYPDGSRRVNARNPRTTKLCASNPAVWSQWLADAVKQIEANPLLRVISVSPNDGYASGHCVCENCLAWDHPEGEKVTWNFGGGVKFEGVVQSDRDVRFANTLARMLKKRFPNRELYVQLHAYGLARNAPVGVSPDDNVIISSVSSFHMRSPEARSLAMRQHANWAKKTKHLMWRPNLGSQAGLRWGMPDVAMTQAGEDFRFVADRNGTGLFFDLHWFHWSTQGPQYYALAHLAWDPYTDINALMDEYYQRAYGPAAVELKAYWQLLERTRMEFVTEEPSRQRAFDIPKKYTPAMLAEARGYLDAAENKLAGSAEMYPRRLQFTRCGLDFMELVVDTRKLMQRFEESKGEDTEARAAVMANWGRAEKMKESFPPFAINWQSVFRTPEPHRKIPKSTMGLHPDVPSRSTDLAGIARNRTRVIFANCTRANTARKQRTLCPRESYPPALSGFPPNTGSNVLNLVILNSPSTSKPTPFSVMAEPQW